MSQWRLDQALVRAGLAPSRSKAKELILAGAVENESGTPLTDPSFLVTEAELLTLQLRVNDLIKYVSRAGLKLEAALSRTKLSVDGLLCLDVGQSTGGFSQVLLLSGAEKVVGFDVGHGQLHPHLKSEERLVGFEGINAKEAHQHPELAPYLEQMDVLVGDVSFISLRLYLSEVLNFLKPGGRLLFLVKPQFELDRSRLNKKGIVKDAGDYVKIESQVREHLEALGLKVVDYFESSTPGQDGNREFFVYAQKSE